MPLHLALSAGQDHYNGLATNLIDGLKEDCLAERAYDSEAIRDFVRLRGAWANIPPKRNRRNPICFSPDLYNEPNCVERLWLLMKEEPDGLAAGAIAEAIGCPHNTLSSHRGILTCAGLHPHAHRLFWSTTAVTVTRNFAMFRRQCG
ncbi:transposase [Sinorhizobium alkalisoli]|uniref:transposase n=1 Tax=Sinorhizobium alkalisoli TaxID=1752398 RepID=UPI0012A86C6A|nr:transposase [Sinorhizobium alkalisoli]QFI69868.1 Mobile element protein [Sinorhizobium alkalisoli]